CKPLIGPEANYCVCTISSDERNEKCAEYCGVHCQAVDSLLIVPPYSIQHILYCSAHGGSFISMGSKSQVKGIEMINSLKTKLRRNKGDIVAQNFRIKGA
ncbi:MAG: hypothetical protein KDE46_23320, partial [Caldilineaceae bacterium]|nr:hypothetical protein [Caldilineaceae bacterium]